MNDSDATVRSLLYECISDACACIIMLHIFVRLFAQALKYAMYGSEYLYAIEIVVVTFATFQLVVCIHILLLNYTQYSSIVCQKTDLCPIHQEYSQS